MFEKLVAIFLIYFVVVGSSSFAGAEMISWNMTAARSGYQNEDLEYKCFESLESSCTYSAPYRGATDGHIKSSRITESSCNVYSTEKTCTVTCEAVCSGRKL